MNNLGVRDVDVVVIGAGQAGLSSAYHLRRSGLEPGRDFVVLDHSPRPGGAWQFRWPSLTYAKVHGMHSLPGMELTGADDSRPSSEVVGEYFAAYERTFALSVRRPVGVSAVREGEGGRLLVETSAGTWAARALINATGTWDRPFWPRYPGQETFLGQQLHTADYPGPQAFTGRRVVVVGGGTSGVQHLMEIAAVAAETTWVTRRPPVFRDGPFGEDQGRAAVALVDERVRRGLPPQSVVSVTGLPVTEAVARARADGVLDRLPMFDSITPNGVAWADGRTVDADVILWATGFRAVIDHLAPLRLRERGGGIRVEGTRAVRDERVHLVGYGPSASTVGANRAGREAVRAIMRLLERRPADGVAVGAVPADPVARGLFAADPVAVASGSAGRPGPADEPVAPAPEPVTAPVRIPAAAPVRFADAPVPVGG
ncbi:NAD(P)-binding domain-containing protein [Streptomyces agglomeratus]|uniref:NAD(P)-binding domain-containing protein n=1 Tax=Streptomyces agglomeratus TaxID=285458 RepID=UPI0009A0148C|nr:NAD(P)-binding domain-containing protein [Streptomyces agglomeratus]